MRDWLVSWLWGRSPRFVLLCLYVAEHGAKPLSHWVFINTPVGMCLRAEALRRGDLAQARRITEILDAAER